MRALLLVGLLVLTGLEGALAATTMMGSNAPVHISWVRLPAEGAPEGHRAVTIEFAAGDQATAGEHLGRLTATFTRAGEPKPFFTHDQELMFSIQPDQTSQGTLLSSLALPQQLSPGAFLVNATLRGNEGETTRIWGTYESGEFRIAGSRSLESGVGVIQDYGVSTLDFDGVEGDDLWLTSSDSSTPPTANLTLRAHQWETDTHRGSGLTGSAEGTSFAGTHKITLNRSALGRVFQGLDPSRLAASVMESASWRWDENGDFVVTYTTTPPSPNGAQSTSPGSPPPVRGPDVFFDLHHMRSIQPAAPFPDGKVLVNVSSWSVDEEGYRDVFFYHGATANRSEAENMSVEDRRASSLELHVLLEVNRVDSGRELEFRISRVTPPVEEGAWIEFRNASGLFRRLLHTNETDPNATPAIMLHMPPSDGFVEQNGTSTWVWVGHFSVQRLTVFWPFIDPDSDGSPEPSHPRRVEIERIPAPPALAVVGLLAALCLGGRRRR